MDDVTDLVKWLRAQLDDDERLIERNSGQKGLGDDGSFPDYRTYDGDDLAAADDYLDEFNPKRMRAEVDAKRRILDLHPHRRFASLPEEWPDHWKAEIKQAFPGTEQPYVGCERDDRNSNYEVVEPGWWCQTVRLLALPYAGRPGYREDWRP